MMLKKKNSTPLSSQLLSGFSVESGTRIGDGQDFLYGGRHIIKVVPYQDYD